MCMKVSKIVIQERGVSREKIRNKFLFVQSFVLLRIDLDSKVFCKLATSFYFLFNCNIFNNLMSHQLSITTISMITFLTKE